MAMYIAVLRNKGKPLISGTIQNHVLRNMWPGTYTFPPTFHAADYKYFRYCSGKSPVEHRQRWGYHLGKPVDGGAGVAFAFSIAACYLEAGVKAGLDMTTSLPGFLDLQYPTLISWKRANFGRRRRLWARIMKERLHAKDPRSWMLRFILRPAVTLTAPATD